MPENVPADIADLVADFDIAAQVYGRVRRDPSGDVDEARAAYESARSKLIAQMVRYAVENSDLKAALETQGSGGA
jgi:hypothetical protein